MVELTAKGDFSGFEEDRWGNNDSQIRAFWSKNIKVEDLLMNIEGCFVVKKRLFVEGRQDNSE